MQGLSVPRFLPLVFWIALIWAGPAAQATESHDAASAAADGAAADAAAAPQEADPLVDPARSPWEHPLWHNATAVMRLYVCDYARRPPSWCADQQPAALPGNTALPDIQGPPLSEEDAKWLAFIETADPANLTREEVAMVRKRAAERRDPQAMEILGFLYARGLSVQRDYVEAYRWYGLAFLAGEERVKPNMDICWHEIQRNDPEAALVLTQEFDALTNGEVPASLRSPPAQ